MNREKVIELARQAKLPCYFRTGEVVNVDALERFATLINEGTKQVLQELLHLLGPTAPACCGCAEEWQAAIDLIKGELE